MGNMMNLSLDLIPCLKYGVAIPSTCEFFETHRDHLLAVLKSLGFVARVSVKANSEKEIVGRQFYDSLIKELCGKNTIYSSLSLIPVLALSTPESITTTFSLSTSISTFLS